MLVMKRSSQFVKLTIVDGKIVYGDKIITLLHQQLAVIPSWSPVKYYGGYQK